MSWASASATSRAFGSTYSTSYATGSTTYMSRNSTSRDSGIGGYSSHKAIGSRPLPHGPGPLDSSGKRLSNYSVSSQLESTRRNRTPISTRTGPVKANHALSYNTTSSTAPSAGSKYSATDYSRHTGGATSTGAYGRRSSITNNPITGTGTTREITSDYRSSRPLSGYGGARTPSKSTSLNDLSSLSLTDNSCSSTSSSNRNKAVTAGVSAYKEPSGYHHTSSSSTRNTNGYYRDSNNNDDIFRSTKPPLFEDSRPDGTLRTGYTPSMSRETSPTNNNYVNAGGVCRRLTNNAVAVERGDSPPKSSLSNQSSNSSMSNGMYSGYSSSSAGSFSRSSVYSPLGSKYRDGGRVGLRNMGNTCFMNSVLQCLSNTRILLDYCLDEGYQRDINTTTSNMKGGLIRAYSSLMQALWKEKTTETSVSPTAFKTQIQKFAARFMGYSQQDSQEFLRYLLEGLHEDVNRVTKKPAPIILDDAVLEKKSDNEKAVDYWKAYINRDNSQIVDIFVGQLKSELKFTSCSHRSVTFDPFWDLSLPIPKNRTEINIEDCIRLFMKEEELAAEERPNCQKCKQRRACLKMFSIHKFPKILVLHLKRFSQERYGRKLTALVDFPITGLDLSEYAAQGSSGGRRVLYDLYAVSNHSGGTGSGHYTAYCKNPYTSDWSFFNDSRVSPARPNQAVSSEAYVLFYELSSQSSAASRM